MSLSPGSRVGPYEIVAPLGAGGMGVVYRARDGRLNRDVAIKVLPDAFARDDERLVRFTREAQTLASLNHPNIAAIYGIEEAEGMRALVMELVEGDDLSHRIALGAIPIDEALPIAKQIAEALEAAHELGIVHRDLKPANIKVRADGTVKVLDFGLAKAMESGSGIGEPGSPQLANSPTITSPVLTARGVILGTASYMSPEQAAGKAVDKRSDIFSLGVVMLEMLTGQPVFTGETVSHVLASVLKSEPDWAMLPADTPPLIRRLLRRCLEKARKRRLDSAAAARLEIEEALTAPAGPTTYSIRSRALPWVAVGILGMALGYALLVWSPGHAAPGLTTRTNLSISRDNSLTIGAGTAISPDGRTLAFVANSAQGARLYVRALDDWEPRALPMTEGASNPFFSPDGKWIAFVRDGNLLKKIPVSGGPPQDICKTGDQSTFGGNWQPDGTIVFGAWPQVGLWRVSSDGGTPRPIIQPSEGRGSGVKYEDPEPLPDGKGILFTLSREGRTSIMALAPGANTPRTIVESGSHPRYLPTGQLVYVVDSHLTAVPFDLERLAVGGGATVVVDDVSDLNSSYDVSVSGVLVYLTAGSSVRNIVWRDRKGETVRLGAGSHHFEFLALSPDGNKLSVNVREGRSRNIWTGDVTSGLLTRLTFGNDDWFGVWSRDGRRLFYTAGAKEGYNIFSIPTDGSGKAMRITESAGAKNPTSVSPDGDTILFNGGGPGNGGIWELSLSRKESRPFTKTGFGEYAGVFSSDGHWVAYQSDESGQLEVYVQAYPGPGAKRRVSLQGGGSPVWSHSGRELFYQTATAVFSVPVLDAHDLRMGTPQRLFGYAVDGQPRMAVSPDDQRFLMLDPAGTNQSSQINVVQNWFEDLKARVPIK